MPSNGQFSRLVKYPLRLFLTLLLFSSTQCSFLHEPGTQVDFDLSDDEPDEISLLISADIVQDKILAVNDTSLGHDSSNHVSAAEKKAASINIPQFLQVIADDLTRSGRFKVTIQDTARQKQADPPGEDNTTVFVSHGSFILHGDKLLIDFTLYLSGQAQKLNSYQRLSTPSDFRNAAHRVSDHIFQTALGVRGPFSSKIAFVTAHGNINKRLYGLWIADADGHNRVPLYSSSEPIMSPSWSPNGKQIAFIAFKKNDRQGLFIYDLEQKSVREIKLWRKGLVGAPSWSPDSGYLAFTFIKNGNADIYALDLRADEELRLTHAKSIDTEAVWMPDSRSVIFTSDRAGTPQLYQIKLDGSDLTRVTYNGRENAQANVSPQGKNIAMIHKQNGRYQIAVLNRLNKKLKVLTHGSVDESPSFSPGGSMILYSSVDNQHSYLNIISSNGKSHHVVAKFKDVRQPTWSPLL